MRPEDYGLTPDPSTESFFELLNVDIETRAQNAVPEWTEDVARVVEHAVSEWAIEHVYGNTDIDQERYEDVYKPALLWRFYTHLGDELKKIGEGHETVLFNSLREGNG
jgi:hypothetical protein